ncbi:hypothetical protein PR048_020187 [Dryococelus australis]|uniref:CCHC-type domain-containing protein n=1 Tax=Dryococelus australis TaxID=614101 RepID=A0ABQ9H5M0_9NEOP|nr:hypothetical protein PR048_020187 [Dryococelus australis]
MKSVVGCVNALIESFDEPEIVKVILENLSPKFKTHSVGHNTPGTWNELLKWGVEVENNIYVAKLYDQEKTQKKVACNNVYVTGNSTGGKSASSYTCFRCRKDGHLARQCCNRKDILTCFSCGKDGHEARQCYIVKKAIICVSCGKKGHYVQECKMAHSDKGKKQTEEVAILEVKGDKVLVLLDTGSTSCFISQYLASFLVNNRQEQKSQLSKDEWFQLLAANGKCCNVKTKLRLDFQLASYSWTKELWIIADLICSMILGIPASINFQTNMLTFGFRPQVPGIKLVKDKPKTATCSN